MIKRLSSGSPFEKAFGYSRAVVDGDMIHVSGTTGYDYAKMEMPDSAAAQTENALATIAGVLEQAGSGLNDVVRARYYLSNAAYEGEVGPVLGRVLGDIRPAASMVITGLIRPEMKIEIEVTARKGAGAATD